MSKCTFLCFLFAFAQHFIRCKTQFFRIKKGSLRYAVNPKYAEQRIRFELAETVCPFIPDCERGYCAVLQTSLFAASFFADVHAILPTANPTPLYFSPKTLYTETNHNRCKGELT